MAIVALVSIDLAFFYLEEHEHPRLERSGPLILNKSPEQALSKAMAYFGAANIWVSNAVWAFHMQRIDVVKNKWAGGVGRLNYRANGSVRGLDIAENADQRNSEVTAIALEILHRQKLWPSISKAVQATYVDVALRYLNSSGKKFELPRGSQEEREEAVQNAGFMSKKKGYTAIVGDIQMKDPGFIRSNRKKNL